ncbi:unnamed protein product [Callosobruchus maculatus]|uniref:Uncharacterized protein n=1 Tax=Callosobruchus maculatus TaxID=64391 RepID=A0A653BJ83_CALMS|nr:unnamed protein product [Callosobruchus maculatus]
MLVVEGVSKYLHNFIIFESR